MALLTLENVTKRFGGLTAVHHMSLEIDRGEAIGIVGPNGSGKTTLFNLISGVYSPDEGRIFFEGQEITKLPAYKRTQLGIGRTFQIPRPFSAATVRENVAIGALFGTQSGKVSIEDALEIADYYLKLTGFWEHRHKNAGALTPVEKKMMEIARALAMKPKLLLLDESMAGMPPKDVDSMVQFLKKIKEDEGIAIVSMVEHIMRAVVGFAERVIVMHQGRKFLEAPTSEALSDPRVVEIYLGRPVKEEHAETQGS
ncbi:Lipopolysaccharide export system ATP-binding protein LptB [bacterium HR07]|nr:Lipopolysaccharide export system ATP-binding protein LptB [bacterium HR07]